MTFFQRLKRFMIGVTIGLLLSVFFFSDKVGVLTGWTPSNRVKARVIESYIDDTPLSTCLLECHAMDWDSLRVLVADADVEFSRSDTDGEPKEYQLTSEEPQLDMRFAVKDSTVSLVGLTKTATSCNCLD